MHEILYKITGVLKQSTKIQIAVDLRHGNVRNDEKKITNIGELFIYYVVSD